MGLAKRGSSIAVLLITLTLFPNTVLAKCVGIPMDPISGVNWQCIFPIKIAGIPMGGTDLPDVPDQASTPICVCPAPPPLFVRPGIPLAFWEPNLIVETVKDPACFPTLGIGIDFGLNKGTLGGSSNEDEIGQFSQAHYFNFPIWSVLGLMTDFICVESGTINLAYMTEIDPLWQNDLLSMIINPEAVLFANPYAVYACMADAISSTVGLSLSPLFWCMGSWGPAYPLTGHVGSADIVEANAGIAGRMLYKQARQFNLFDCAINICACLPSPIWIKHNLRMHIVKPRKSSNCMPVGRSGWLWASAKNFPFTGMTDNFSWLIFKKRSCCAF